MSEYAALLKEMGGGTSGSDDTIKVEHVFIFSMTEKWERTLTHKIIPMVLDLARETVKSLRLVAIAASVALLLWGTSHLIKSIRGDNDSSHGNKDGSAKQ